MQKVPVWHHQLIKAHWRESNHRLRKTNIHTCTADTNSVEITKMCSKSAHPNFIWKLCLLLLPDACCVINSGEVLSEGFLVLSELELRPLSAGKVERRWITEIPQFLSRRCLFTISTAEGCVCVRNPKVQCHTCSVSTKTLELFGFYLNLGFDLERKTKYQHSFQCIWS